MQHETVIQSATAEESAAPAAAPYFDRLRVATDRLAARLDPKRSAHEGGFSTGEVADLRRLDQAKGVDEAGPTFWRIVVEVLESVEIQLVPAYAEADHLKPWLAILRTWAELAGLHRRSRHLGEALEVAKVSEMRLVRLLRADGDELHDQLRKVAHQLRSAAEPVDFIDIARLVLSDDGDDGATVRRRIAASYFRSEYQQKKTGASAA